MSGFERFLSGNAKEFNGELWDALVRALDARFRPVENQLNIQREVANQLIARGTQVIEDGIGPAITESQTKLAEILAIYSQALQASNVEHVQDQDNPHAVTAEQVGSYTQEEVDAAFQTNAEASDNALAQAIATILGLPPETLNSIAKLATAIGNDADFANTMALGLSERLAVAYGIMQGVLNINGHDLYLDNGTIIVSDADGPQGDRSGDNIDHLWHEDTINLWHFCSDALYKAPGNSGIQAGRYRSGRIAITDDTVGIIEPLYNGGWILISRGDSTIYPGGGLIAYFDVGQSLSIAMYNANSWYEATTSNVTGTSGTDGKTTIAVQPGVIKVENRSGSTNAFTYTIFQE